MSEEMVSLYIPFSAEQVEELESVRIRFGLESLEEAFRKCLELKLPPIADGFTGYKTKHAAKKHGFRTPVFKKGNNAR